MTLTNSDIQKLAVLARIKVDDDLIDDVTHKLDDVIGMIDQLQAIDASGVKPMAHPLDATQRLREDIVTEHDQHEKYQAIAPSVSDNLYLVPKVID